MSKFLVLTCGDYVRGEYVTSLVATQSALQDEGHSLVFGNSQGALIAFARHQIWQKSRTMDFDKLIWIDGDISWKPEHFASLVQSGFDIVTGAYLDELGQVVATRLDGDRVSREQLDGQEPFEVAWCGFGFVSLSKDVVAALPEPFIKSGEYGEDVSFCMNARNMGFKVFLHPMIKVTHHKTIAITP